MTPVQQKQILMGWRTEVFQKKQQIFETSDDCKGLMIVQTGCLRVYMISEQGKEVSLFRLFPGDICVLSAACMVEEHDFDIIIEAAEYTEVATIPAGSEAERLELSRGRDIVLSPAQAGEPLNNFGYPCAEVDGVAVDFYSPDSFIYSITFAAE